MIVTCSCRFAKGTRFPCEAANSELCILTLICLQPPATNKFNSTGGGTVSDWEVTFFVLGRMFTDTHIAYCRMTEI